MKNLKIITFNIRRCKSDDGINNWEYRRELVAEILKKHNPDVAVFQEVLFHQLKDLKKILPDYEYTGIGRDDGLEAGEFSPIFYRGISIESEGTFWLSDTPDLPSCSWPGMTRICTWASFSGDTPFAVFNTHLDYKFESTQMKSIALLEKKTAFFPDEYPVFLTGDFNFFPESVPYQQLTHSFRDSFSEENDTHEPTFHGFEGRTEAYTDHVSGRIDYIWNRGNLKVMNCRILRDNPSKKDGVYPSDHWPVFCEVLLF